ncbi:MAG: DUF1080 domain-containing protein [Acidobacteriota bacterium]
MRPARISRMNILGGWTTGLPLILILGVIGTSGLKGADHLRSEPGFRSLFNGNDLSGWHKNPVKIVHGTGGHWIVEDGAITGEQDPPGSGNGGILLSDETFGDSEVAFDTKPDWGIDSGFFLRSNEKGECYQIMIDYYDGGNVGEIYREGLDGWSNQTLQIFGVFQDQEKKILSGTRAQQAKKDEYGAGGKARIALANWSKVWKVNDWNTIRARVEGEPPTITTYVNNRLISRFVSDKSFEALGSKGRLGLQVHGGKTWPKGAKVRFRNIQVKQLSRP